MPFYPTHLCLFIDAVRMQCGQVDDGASNPSVNRDLPSHTDKFKEPYQNPVFRTSGSLYRMAPKTGDFETKSMCQMATVDLVQSMLPIH